IFFTFNILPTTQISTLSLHDALPISFTLRFGSTIISNVSRTQSGAIKFSLRSSRNFSKESRAEKSIAREKNDKPPSSDVRSMLRSEEHTSELLSPYDLVCRLLLEKKK